MNDSLPLTVIPVIHRLLKGFAHKHHISTHISTRFHDDLTEMFRLSPYHYKSTIRREDGVFPCTVVIRQTASVFICMLILGRSTELAVSISENNPKKTLISRPVNKSVSLSACFRRHKTIPSVRSFSVSILREREREREKI